MKQFDCRLENAFVPMPVEFHETIELAFERGDKTMRKRNKICTLLNIAAVFTVMFAVGGLAVNNLNTPGDDNVVFSNAARISRQNSAVFASGKEGANRLLPMQHAEEKPEPQNGTEEPIPIEKENPTSTAISKARPTPTPMPCLVPDFVSYPIPADEAELVPAAQEDSHFYHGDFTDAEALYILLGNAYYAHLQENSLQPDSRVVYVAAEELKAVYAANPSGKEAWITLVQETLQSVLGFSADFIAEHYLVNDVIACLSVESEYGQGETYSEPTPEPTASPLLEPGEIAYMASYPVLVGEAAASSEQ